MSIHQLIPKFQNSPQTNPKFPAKHVIPPLSLKSFKTSLKINSYTHDSNFKLLSDITPIFDYNNLTLKLRHQPLTFKLWQNMAPYFCRHFSAYSFQFPSLTASPPGWWLDLRPPWLSNRESASEIWGEPLQCHDKTLLSKGQEPVLLTLYVLNFSEGA